MKEEAPHPIPIQISQAHKNAIQNLLCARAFATLALSGGTHPVPAWGWYDSVVVP